MFLVVGQVHPGTVAKYVQCKKGTRALKERKWIERQSMTLEYPTSDRLVFAPSSIDELLEYGYKQTVANMRHNRTRDSAMTWGEEFPIF
jgi:hypothetical protein